MRGFVNLLLLFLAVANSNSQNFNNGFDANFPPEYFGVPENVLKEDKFYYFDTDLLQAISNAEPYSNIFISPLSIKTALTMILEGSANDSEKEIKRALRLPDNKDLIRKQFRELLEHFENKKQGVTLKLGNRIFVSNKLTPIQNYVDILVNYYFSNVTKVNFMNSKQSADVVNDWVTKETHGYITSIADQGTFSPDTSIFLANALYFKGIWLRSFSEQGTQTKCFHLFNGKCQDTPMMDVVDNFKYDEVQQLDAKIVELPYTGNEFSMVVLLPNKKDGIHQLARDIRTSINSYIDNLTETEVYVTLPRFSIDYSTDLVKYLPSVNIHTISQPNADLSGLTAQLQGKISKMLHKARIEVNEEGTVAAAVTGAVVIPLMGSMKPRFRADHPFLFFIRHIPTKTILFEGRVMTPEKASPQQQNPTQHQQQRPQNPNSNKVFTTSAQQPQQIHFTEQNQNPINFDTQPSFPINNNQFATSQSNIQQPQQQAFPTQLSSQTQSQGLVQQQIRPQTTETQTYQQQQYYANLHRENSHINHNVQTVGQNRGTSNRHHENQPKPPEERIYFNDQKRPPPQGSTQHLG